MENTCHEHVAVAVGRTRRSWAPMSAFRSAGLYLMVCWAVIGPVMVVERAYLEIREAGLL